MNIIELNKNIKCRNQFVFDKQNILLGEVKNAFGCDDVQAKRFIASICKFLAFYLEAQAKGLITYDVVTYLRKCIADKLVRKDDAYVLESYGFYDGVFQHTFADYFGIKSIAFDKYDKFIEWTKTQTEYIATIRIVNRKKTGKHSLISYKQNDKLFISDTSNRGIATPFEKEINAQNFIYATIMIQNA